MNSLIALAESSKNFSQGFILGGYRRVNTPANVEITDDRHGLRAAGLHKVIQNSVDNRFVKRSFVAVGPQVKLKRLKLHTEFRRHIANPDCGKVRLPRAGAETGKFGTLHRNLKIPFGTRIGKRLQLFARLGGHIAIHLNAAKILFQFSPVTLTTL
jgi:hypothetical protein